MGIGNHALRSARNVIRLVTLGIKTPELVDHCGVAAAHVVSDRISLRIRGVGAVEVRLNVEVETVDRSSTKWTRSAPVDPCVSLRAKSSPEEISKVDSGGVVGDPVVNRVAASNGQKDFSAETLTCCDIWADLRTIVEETGLDAIRVAVIGTGTGISEVVSWPSTGSLVGENVNERNNDNVNVRILANGG